MADPNGPDDLFALHHSLSGIRVLRWDGRRRLFEFDFVFDLVIPGFVFNLSVHRVSASEVQNFSAGAMNPAFVVDH